MSTRKTYIKIFLLCQKECENIQIDQEKCIGCIRCSHYCPLGSIKKRDIGKPKKYYIDQDDCVECGVCLRAGVCPTDAIFWQELTWPRAIRQAFSAVLVGYKALKDHGIEEYNETKATATIGGRGTEEMKTNDVTGRYKEGEVGVAVEFGRPGVGFYFRDVEKVAKVLINLGLEFQTDNPLTSLLDETGNLKYPEIKNEKAMSCILETNTVNEKAVEVLNSLKKIADDIDTVISVDIITKCIDGKIPILNMLEK